MLNSSLLDSKIYITQGRKCYKLYLLSQIYRTLGELCGEMRAEEARDYNLFKERE